MSMIMVRSSNRTRTSVASCTAGAMPEMAVADGDHAAVCAGLAAHIRREAKFSGFPGAGERLGQVADLVEASAHLPAGNYTWTAKLSPATLMTYRITEIMRLQADLALVD